MFELSNEFSGSRVPGTTTSEPRWRHIFNLDNLPWLGDHRIHNESSIPAAMLLIMVVSAAMDISNDKQPESIEVSEVTIERSIVFEESSVKIETSLSISGCTDSAEDGIDVIQAEFSLNEAPAQDQSMATAAKGKLRITFSDHQSLNAPTSSSPRQPKPSGLIPVNIEQFYNSLSEVGLTYTGRFRGLISSERRMGFACAVLTPTTDGAPGVSTLLHPTGLEACFQTILLAFAAPRDGSLWTAFTPTKIARLTFFLNSSVGLDTSASVKLDTHLQIHTPGYKTVLPMINGDISAYGSETGQLVMRIEGLMMSPMISSTERQDKLLYLKTTWQQDILSGVVLEQDNHTTAYEGLGISQVHRYILAATRQISHRNAKLRILQVGTSSINLVQAVSQELGVYLDSYTILDASDRAIEDMKLEMPSDNQAIRFEVLDISRGVVMLDEATVSGLVDSGFFDLVILLKPSELDLATLECIKDFLKPGGFLLMTVSATDVSLPGAADTAHNALHDLLQSVGFSGLDSSKPDPREDSSLVILSQALDDQLSFLRAPLDSEPPFSTSETLLVVGGSSQRIEDLVRVIQSKLKCVWHGDIVAIRSLAQLNRLDLDEFAAVLSLIELDQSVLKDLSPNMFQGLHQLLDRSKTVLWVTRGARNQNPHQSGTIGLMRAVQSENPEKVLQILDLDEIDGTESLVADSFLRLIGGVLMRDDRSHRLWTVEPELCVQGRRLLIPRVLFDKKRNNRLNSSRRRLEARDIYGKESGTIVRPIDPSGLFSPSKTYLLVGLSGHIGQSITRWMVHNGVRHVVITSRNPNKDQFWKRELERLGANIVIKAADVTKKQDVIDLRNDILRTMPPIGGVANGAMVQSNCFFSDLTYDTLQEVLKPKVDGSLVLDEVFSEDDLEFFLLFSSISAVVGQPFQSNYDTANNFMTGLAFQRRARKLPASVINLGPIIGLGFIQNLDTSGGSEAVISTLKGLDYMIISERDLHHILAEAILLGKSDETPEIITGNLGISIQDAQIKRLGNFYEVRVDR